MKLVIGVLTAAILLAGCSAGGSNQATVGHVAEGGSGGILSGSGGAAIAVHDGGPQKALTVHVESPPGVTNSTVTPGGLST